MSRLHPRLLFQRRLSYITRSEVWILCVLVFFCLCFTTGCELFSGLLGTSDIPPDVLGLRTVPGVDSIEVTWIDPSANEFDYIEVSWSPPSSRIQPIIVQPGIQDCLVAGLLPGTAYTIRVVTRNASGTSSKGIAVIANTLTQGGVPDTIPPAEVTSLVIVPDIEALTAFWVNPTDADFDYPVLEYRTETGTYLPYNSYPDPAGTTITGLVSGVVYTVRIRTVDTSGNMSAGATATAIPLSQTSSPDIEIGFLPPTSGGEISFDRTDGFEIMQGEPLQIESFCDGMQPIERAWWIDADRLMDDGSSIYLDTFALSIGAHYIVAAVLTSSGWYGESLLFYVRTQL